MQFFLNVLLSGVISGSVYALIGLGFVLVYKCSGIFNLAQGQLVIFGAYLFYAFAVQLGVPIWLGLLLTFIAAIALGLAIERLAIRPLIGQPIFAVITVTLVIGTLLEGVMMLGWGCADLVLPRLFPVGEISIAGIGIAYESLGFLISSLLLLLAFTLFFNYSKMGLRMMGTSEDQQTAQSLGVRVKRIFALAWVIACLVSTIGGILLTNITGANYYMVSIGLKAIAVVMLGGMESILGVVIAGPIVGLLESLTKGYIDPMVGGGFGDVSTFLVIVIIMIFMPHGLFGWERIERV